MRCDRPPRDLEGIRQVVEDVSLAIVLIVDVRPALPGDLPAHESLAHAGRNCADALVYVTMQSRVEGKWQLQVEDPVGLPEARRGRRLRLGRNFCVGHGPRRDVGVPVVADDWRGVPVVADYRLVVPVVADDCGSPGGRGRLAGCPGDSGWWCWSPGDHGRWAEAPDDPDEWVRGRGSHHARARRNREGRSVPTAPERRH